jgi:hypothetical protein
VAPREFWQVEPEDGRKAFAKQVLRWTVVFLALVGGVLFAFWWSGSAIQFGASRVTETTPATYSLVGVVLDSKTGAPIPWVNVRDDPSGRPPLHEALGGMDGTFRLDTIAEPHSVVFSALGYREKRVKIGRIWYIWMPSGQERVEIRLDPEPKKE